MNSYLWNLIELNAIILLLYLTYRMIRNRTSITSRRWSLLGIPVFASLAIGVKSLIPEATIQFGVPVVELDPIVIGGKQHLVSTTTTVDIPGLLWVIYGIGVVAFSLFLIYRIIYVIRLFGGRTEKEGDFKVARSGSESFSFFRFIQLQSELDENAEDIILEHEKIHALKRHSIDLIFIDIVQVLSWFNPALFFMKRELKKLHEYEVDQIMYDRHGVDYMKFLLHHSLGTSSNQYLLTHQFNDPLTLKKRIETMKTKKRSQKTLVFLIPALALSTCLFSLTNAPKSNNSDLVAIQNDPVEKNPDQLPEFPGGDKAMMEFMSKNVNYPEAAKKQKIEGVVYASFVIGKDGNISEAKIAKGVHQSLNDETLRVIRSMPKWNPGMKEGKKVKTQFTLPIHYKLPKQE